MLKISTLLVVMLIMGIGSVDIVGQASRQSETVKRFVGTWRLISIESDSAETNASRGAHPTGLLSYDATGHMIV